MVESGGQQAAGGSSFEADGVAVVGLFGIYYFGFKRDQAGQVVHVPFSACPNEQVGGIFVFNYREKAMLSH